MDQPDCRAKVRGIASSLAFVLANDLMVIEDIGLTTAATAANICAGVFGRDDGEREFVFTQKHVDTMCVSNRLNTQPAAGIRGALSAHRLRA